MYVKRNYSLWKTFRWSYKPFLYGTLYSTIITFAFLFCKTRFHLEISFPWEARKIWGSIVNNSRAFGAAVMSFVQGTNKEIIQKQLMYKHIAWLVLLRFQLRSKREWEHVNERLTDGFSSTVQNDTNTSLKEEIQRYLSDHEINALLKYANPATQILKTQSVALQKFHDEGYFESFRHMEFYELVATFYEDQGKSERIKNFPFPRQYASVALWQTFIFTALIPFGMLSVFDEIKTIMFWLTIHFSGLLIWVFFLMEKIGDYSENPFEGGYNDVPIDSIARAIEIDLLQMLEETNIPSPVQNKNGVLM